VSDSEVMVRASASALSWEILTASFVSTFRWGCPLIALAVIISLSMESTAIYFPSTPRNDVSGTRCTPSQLP
jgi:hypothetical protein